MASFLVKEISSHTSGCQVLWLRHSVHMEDCGGWWLSSGCQWLSVAVCLRFDPCICLQWGKITHVFVYSETRSPESCILLTLARLLWEASVVSSEWKVVHITNRWLIYQDLVWIVNTLCNLLYKKVVWTKPARELLLHMGICFEKLIAISPFVLRSLSPSVPLFWEAHQCTTISPFEAHQYDNLPILQRKWVCLGLMLAVLHIVRACVCVTTLASLPGLPTVQFLIACSMQERRGKAWPILSHECRQCLPR